MLLVNMRDMLNHSYQNGYAVGSFDLVSLDFLEAILSAAEASRALVILSLAESHFEYYDFELAMAASEAVAKHAKVPEVIHLDHGASFEAAVKAINLGCNGVMVDASHEAFVGDVGATQRIVNMAHVCGVPVEGELGYVASVKGEDTEKHPGEVVYTSVEEIEAYVQQTGVDFLAVSIGTVHGRMKGEPALDLGRLQGINGRLDILLVIHCSTDLSDDQFRKLIVNGASKINYYTALADAAGAWIRSNAVADARCGYTGIVKGIQDAMHVDIERWMEVWGSSG